MDEVPQDEQETKVYQPEDKKPIELHDLRQDLLESDEEDINFDPSNPITRRKPILFSKDEESDEINDFSEKIPFKRSVPTNFTRAKDKKKLSHKSFHLPITFQIVRRKQNFKKLSVTKRRCPRKLEVELDILLKKFENSNPTLRGTAFKLEYLFV
jgi:hypothetical protein